MLIGGSGTLTDVTVDNSAAAYVRLPCVHLHGSVAQPRLPHPEAPADCASTPLQSGGGIFIVGASQLTNVRISRAYGDWDGGGLYAQGPTTMTNVQISNCSSGRARRLSEMPWDWYPQACAAARPRHCGD